MPAIEFVGYSRQEALERMEKYTALFAHLEFADDFIFIIDSGSKVIGLNGLEQPLVRVRSRYPERNGITQRILSEHEDVETFVIQFHPRTSRSSD